MRNVLDALIDDFHERPLPELLSREQGLVRLAGKVNAVVGMRRAGKTWFCYQHMKELMEQGVSKSRILYLNFEDDRLLPFSSADFQLILETYYRKFPAHKSQQCYLFLDEAQRIDGWDAFVRRVLDTENMAVCVTGSSSRLLSTEIATRLRGRALTTEIFPLSFREFVRWHGDNPDVHSFGSRTRALLQHHLEQFARCGGFPEVQGLDDELRRQLLRSYVDVVILRDVIERHGVRNPMALRSMVRHLLSTPATRFSVNKYFNDLKSQGVACSKNDLYEYLDHLSDAFLVYQAPVHSRSENVRRVNPRKVYAIDTGLVEATSFHITSDKGAALENLVYMHLRVQGLSPEYYLTKDGHEVDFVVPSPRGGSPSLHQVCWDMSQESARQRETRSLHRAMDELGVEKATIITWLDEFPLNDRIDVVPAWKWLLSAPESAKATSTAAG